MYHRLKKRRDFVSISRDNVKFVTKNFIVLMKKKPENVSQARVGVVASKKVGNAVKRNRAKRLLRHLSRCIFTVQGSELYDYVLIARFSILEASYDRMEQDMLHAIHFLIKKNLRSH